MKRGDVVLVDFPYTDLAGRKVRPALVVQNDLDNQRLKDTVLAMISGNVRFAGEPTHCLIDPVQEPRSGLRGPSVVIGRMLHAIRQDQVIRPLGRLSNAAMQRVDDCLKAALAIP